MGSTEGLSSLIHTVTGVSEGLNYLLLDIPVTGVMLHHQHFKTLAVAFSVLEVY